MRTFESNAHVGRTCHVLYNVNPPQTLNVHETVHVVVGCTGHELARGLANQINAQGGLTRFQDWSGNIDPLPKVVLMNPRVTLHVPSSLISRLVVDGQQEHWLARWMVPFGTLVPHWQPSGPLIFPGGIG
jgi:hypothetical protein